MTDITTLLQTAITDEPPMRLSQGDVIRRGRAARRRSRVVVGAAASAGVLGAATVAATLVTGATSRPHHAGTASLGQLAGATDQHAVVAGRRARPKSGAHVGGITATTLPDLVAQSIGVDLVEAGVSVLAPTGDLDLSAGIGVPGNPYLNVQVVPAGNISSASESCADLSDLSSPDSDGYAGPCSLQHLGDGSVLIVRSGETTTGGYAKAQADLILSDGTAILAEDTNQAADLRPVDRRALARGSDGPKTLPPVVSTKPPLSSAVMSQLVQDLAAAELKA
jgi:hypothetical protein